MRWHSRSDLPAQQCLLLREFSFVFYIFTSAFNPKQSEPSTMVVGSRAFAKAKDSMTMHASCWLQKVCSTMTCVFQVSKSGDHVAAEKLFSKMSSRLSDVVRSRLRELYEFKEQCGHRLGYSSMQNVLLTSYETAICSRSHISRAALLITFQKPRIRAHVGFSI